MVLGGIKKTIMGCFDMFSVQINHGNSLMVWIYYFIPLYYIHL